VALREKAVAAFERQGPPPEYRDRRQVPKAAVVRRSTRSCSPSSTRAGSSSATFPPRTSAQAEIFVARRQRDFARAMDLLNDLAKAVAKLRVDQRFVEAKITACRLAAPPKLSDTQRGEIEKLLKDVTSAFSDGRYDQANKGLNRIAVILDAGPASG